MHRPGADPLNMSLEDFLCDFCVRAWDGTFAMVEGHKGSLICQDCLTEAYRALVVSPDPNAAVSCDCVMCLERREQPGWTSAKRAEATICLRCCRQGATRLEKDMEGEWRRPGGKAPGAGH